MRKLSLLRVLAVGGALGAALSAHAFLFAITGTVDSNGSITSTTSEFSNLAEFGNSYAYDVVLYTGGGGTSTFTNGSSTITLTETGTASNVNNIYSFAGTFVTSADANTSIPNGTSGTYSSTFDLADGLFTFTAAGANPAPEPVSVGLLGFGVAALIRRRKKA